MDPNDYRFDILNSGNIHAKTRNVRPKSLIICFFNLFFSPEDYSSIPKGAKNGIMGGMEFILDAEAFDYAFW